MAVHMLSTIDNPYNPFTEFDEWLQFDHRSGYYTNELLARLTITSSDLSETDQSNAMEQAIDEIVKENYNGVYIKVEAPEGFDSS